MLFFVSPSRRALLGSRFEKLGRCFSFFYNIFELALIFFNRALDFD